MRRMVWRVVLAASIVALAAVVVVSLDGVAAGPRADLVGSAVVADGSASSDPPTTVAPTTAPPSSVPPRGPGFPRRVSIPAIGVDAAVVAVGLEPDGSMELPGASDAGWYQFGAIPGADAGSAVIAAHVDADGRRGAFYDLRRLEVGQHVDVTDRDGTARRFVVTERFQVRKTILPTDELFRAEGQPMLTLITCGGSFDESRGHYFDNIVVRAVPA